MAVWLEETKSIPGGVRQASYGMDSLADVPDFPSLSDEVAAGSDAFAILEQELVMLGSDGVWR